MEGFGAVVEEFFHGGVGGGGKLAGLVDESICLGELAGLGAGSREDEE